VFINELSKVFQECQVNNITIYEQTVLKLVSCGAPLLVVNGWCPWAQVPYGQSGCAYHPPCTCLFSLLTFQWTFLKIYIFFFSGENNLLFIQKVPLKLNVLCETWMPKNYYIYVYDSLPPKEDILRNVVFILFYFFMMLLLWNGTGAFKLLKCLHMSLNAIKATLWNSSTFKTHWDGTLTYNRLNDTSAVARRCLYRFYYHFVTSGFG